MTDLTRRQFLEALATSAVGAVVFTGCQAPAREGLAESRVLSAEDTLTAYEDWYATLCRGCQAGCGALVRVVEGRAKKVEGNPEHPVNQGKLCARGQALVQEEYHPDRLTGPLVGGSPTTWDDGLDRLATRLRQRQGEVVVLTRPLRGHQALVVDRFTRALGASWLTLDLFGEAPLRVAARQVFGQDRLPVFDLQNADYVLSFGADFLSAWLSPVNYSVQYGVFRQGSYRPGQLQARRRGHLVQLEPRFSTTAAAADEWVPTRPGTEGLLALSIAQALVEQGHGDASLAGTLAPYAADNLDLGVPADRVRALAQAFGTSQRPLAIGGGPVGAQTNGTAALAAVLGLNLLVGSPSVRASAPSPLPDLPAETLPSRLADWQALADRLRAGQVETVLVYDANPAFLLPGLGEALMHAPFVVSFSSFVDETTALASLVLPSHLPLEAWGSDVGAAGLTLQQPVVRPLHDTRAFFDVLLAVGEELGGDVQAALPWSTFKDVVRGATPEPVWTSLLQRGGAFAAEGASSAQLPAAVGFQPVPPPRFAGSADDDYVLVPFPHNTLGDGTSAHLPWLQAAPDPLTSVTWQTWAELNPRVAADLGVVEGDVVAVASEYGRVDVPVYVSPAAPPEVLAMPLGQGHSGFGRWARQRGANPLQLLAPLSDAATGALAYGSTRVAVSKTGRRVALPKLEGEAPARQLPDQEVVEVARE